MIDDKFTTWIYSLIYVLIFLRVEAYLVNITYVETAAAKGAVCLDRSPPAYHLSPRFGTGVKSWLVHLKVMGDISYNGFGLEEFVPEKTSAYISQYDLHVPEMTVRETLNFSARFQGVGSRAEIMKEVSRREKQAGIVPESEIDTYMKAISIEGVERSLQTDYILKIMGMDICADTIIGDAMRQGISGGQKK